jgi:Flp pilus assembly pilin Flp
MKGHNRLALCARAAFFEDESGSQLVEWIVVTLILTVAIYAVLQAFGPEIQNIVAYVASRLK